MTIGDPRVGEMVAPDGVDRWARSLGESDR
jgi:hypothetical protein